MQMKLESEKQIEWFWDLSTAENVQLPIKKVDGRRIEGKVNNLKYRIDLLNGSVSVPDKEVVYRFLPEKGNIKLDFSKR